MSKELINGTTRLRKNKRGFRILSFLLGMVFGFIAMLGGLTGAIFWAYTSFTPRTAEEWFGFSNVSDIIGTDSLLMDMAIGDIVADISEIQGMTYSEFMEKYKVSVPENLEFLFDAIKDVKISDGEQLSNAFMTNMYLGHILGAFIDPMYSDLDADAVMPEGGDPLLWALRRSTISGDKGVANMMSTITFSEIQDIIGFTLPDILADIDMNFPISEIGDALNKIPVSKIIKIPEGISEDEISYKLIKKITEQQKTVPGEEPRDYYVSEINELMTEVMDNLFLTDIITPPASLDSTGDRIMDKLLFDSGGNPRAINALSGGMDDIMNDIEIGDLLEASSSENTVGDKIINKLVGKKQPRYELIGGAEYKDKKTGDTVVLGEDISDADLSDEIGYTINEIEALMAEVVDGLLVKDIIDPPSNADSTLKSYAECNANEKVLMNLIYKAPEIGEIDGNYNTINEISDVMEGITEKLYLKDIIAVPLDSAGNPAASYDDCKTLSDKIIFKLLYKDGDVADPSTLDTLSEDGFLGGVVDGLSMGDIFEKVSDPATFSDKMINKMIDARKGSGEDERPYRITEAGELMGVIVDEMYLTDIIPVPDDSDTSIGAKVIRKILYDGVSPRTISEIGSEGVMSDIIDGLYVSDLLPEPAGDTELSDKLITKMRETKKADSSEYKISEIGELMQSVIEDMPLADIINEPTGDSVGEKLFRKILFENPEATDGSKTARKVSELDDIDGIMEGIYLSDIIDEPAGGSVGDNILKKLLFNEDGTGVKLNDLTAVVGGLDERLELRDIIGAPGGSGMTDNIINVLIGEKPDGSGDYYKLNEIDAAFESITIGKMFNPEDPIYKLFYGYVPPKDSGAPDYDSNIAMYDRGTDIVLSKFNGELFSRVFMKTKLGVLQDCGFISDEITLSVAVANLTMEELLEKIGSMPVLP